MAKGGIERKRQSFIVQLLVNPTSGEYTNNLETERWLQSCTSGRI